MPSPYTNDITCIHKYLAISSLKSAPFFSIQVRKPQRIVEESAEKPNEVIKKEILEELSKHLLMVP